MVYRVKARYRESKAREFFLRLTDGSIENQVPDGREILASMKRARITGPKTIEWYETCYCPKPLAHERTTVYDRYLSDIETTQAEDYGSLDGNSFWDRLEEIAGGADPGQRSRR